MKSFLIVLLGLGIYFAFGGSAASSGDLYWENISSGIVAVNAVWPDGRNPGKIFIGTDRAVFVTEDGGNSWRQALVCASGKVNFIYPDNADEKSIYAACGCGLFASRNGGESWKRIYTGKTAEENNCLSIVKLGADELYVGTQAGIFYSRDNGRVWNKFPGAPGNLPISAMAADKANRLIYAAAVDGAYKINPQEQRAERIFVAVWACFEGEEADPEGFDAAEASDEPGYQINYISLDPGGPEYVYLATDRGVVKSEDSGSTWRRLPGSGLLNQRARFVIICPDSMLLAVTESGVFAYSEGRWQELSLRLIMRDIRYLTADKQGNLYAAGDKGLFRSKEGYRKFIREKEEGRALLQVQGENQEGKGNSREPAIQEVQQAAINYAQVVDANWISSQRRLSRLKAILPDFSLDYDKTISTYNNSTVTRFSVGPRSWGLSFKWNLSDLIWSEQQRLIDSQARLLIKLRQDILDEATRLYFERRRLQSELSSCSLPEKRQEKKLKIEEITALLDGLTGGYFSERTR
ncbi:MAG: hypothetical protein ABIH40_05465 [Candidatus Omnitrophota bacterium]